MSADTLPAGNWPETVPILKEHHICKGDYDGPDGTHCLMGWVLDTFPYSRAGKEIQVHVENTLQRLAKAECVITYNDAPRRKRATCAALWNRAMAELGYVKGNPEAKPKKR